MPNGGPDNLPRRPLSPHRVGPRGSRLPGRQHAPVALAAGLLLVMLAIALPVSAEPIGSQVRVSQVGPDGNANFDGQDPAVAYNSQTNQYLAVWEADDSTDNEFEIFGRFVDAAGSPLGGEFRISDMGPDGNVNFDGQDPAVAYNSQANEFLVVWEGDDNTAPLVDNEFEIFGQRLGAAGAELGTNDFRISDMGPNANINFAAFDPAVTYSSQANEYLVVWEGDDNTAPLVDNEFEIFGQRLSAAGAELGTNDFRISDMGPNGDTNFAAFDPAVAYNSQANEFLAVWDGDDNSAPLVNNEFEIFGQRISSAGNDIGSNDFRISDMGPDGNTNFAAFDPAATYSPQANEFLAVWEGDDNTAPLVDNEFEIFGQRLSAAGAEVGTNDFRVSDMGPDGNANFDAFDPALAYSPQSSEYLALWEGDDNTPPLADNEKEIFGQRLSAAGAAVGANDFRLSQMGPNEDPNFDGQDPGVAYGSQPNQYLGVWEGEDNAAPLVDNEFEVYARRSTAGTAGVADTTAPRLRLSGRKRQRFVRQRAVIAFATSNENASLSASVRVSVPRTGKSRVFKLKRVRRSLVANKRARLKFKISRKARRSIRRALGQRKRVRATVTARATDAAGNTGTAKRRIRGRR